jgi:hypothetical protein
LFELCRRKNFNGTIGAPSRTWFWFQAILTHVERIFSRRQKLDVTVKKKNVCSFLKFLAKIGHKCQRSTFIGHIRKVSEAKH